MLGNGSEESPSKLKYKMSITEAIPSKIKLTEDELLVYNLGSEHFDLDPKNIKEAGDAIISNGINISTRQIYMEKVVAANYRGFDLDEHGRLNLLPDLDNLINTFCSAVSIVNQLTRKQTNRVFSMGCGPGRLAIPDIELGVKQNVREMVFNDYSPTSIDVTKTRIIKCYEKDKETKIEEIISNEKENSIKLNIKGFEIKIIFLVGDFIEKGQQLTRDTKKKFDLVLSDWFVTNEIADFSSLENMDELVHRLYSTVSNLLILGGKFIEDVPHVGANGSYYDLLRRKSEMISRGNNWLPGLEGRCLINHFGEVTKDPTITSPYHLRHVLPNRDHEKALNEAGLSSGGNASHVLLPSEVSDHYRPSDEEIKFLMREPKEKRNRVIRDAKDNCLTYPDYDDPMKKFKKIVISTNTGQIEKS